MKVWQPIGDDSVIMTPIGDWLVAARCWANNTNPRHACTGAAVPKRFAQWPILETIVAWCSAQLGYFQNSIFWDWNRLGLLSAVHILEQTSVVSTNWTQADIREAKIWNGTGMTVWASALQLLLFEQTVGSVGGVSEHGCDINRQFRRHKYGRKEDSLAVNGKRISVQAISFRYLQMMTEPSAMHNKMATTNKKITIALKVPFESPLATVFSWVISVCSVTAVYVEDLASSSTGKGTHPRLETV